MGYLCGGQFTLGIEGYPPLAKDRGRHYCIGTHLSTKMADSVENRVVPAVPIPSTLLQFGRTNTAGKR